MGPLLFSFLKGLIEEFGRWIGIRVGVEKDQKPIILNSSNYNSVLNNLKIKGDNNTVTVIITKPENPSQKSVEAMEHAMSLVGEVVDGHEGSIVFDDDVSSYLDAPIFTDEQQVMIVQTRKLGWSREKRNALRFAFKVINLEDAKKCKEALGLFNSMMRSRMSELLRRMYNFTRSGYISEFTIKGIFSPGDYSDEKMDTLLEYFPGAIWLNVFTDFNTLECELVRRANEGVQKISVYARGKSNMNLLRNYIDIYQSDHLGKDPVVYVMTTNKDYTVGCTPASVVILELVRLNEDVERIVARRQFEKDYSSGKIEEGEPARTRFMRRLRRRTKS